jgi:hypothetical protein
MNDEYTQLKRDYEEIAVTVLTLRHNISELLKRYERSDHPRKAEYIARLKRLNDELTAH